MVKILDWRLHLGVNEVAVCSIDFSDPFNLDEFVRRLGGAHLNPDAAGTMSILVQGIDEVGGAWDLLNETLDDAIPRDDRAKMINDRLDAADFRYVQAAIMFDIWKVVIATKGSTMVSLFEFAEAAKFFTAQALGAKVSCPAKITVKAATKIDGVLGEFVELVAAEIGPDDDAFRKALLTDALDAINWSRRELEAAVQD